MLEERYAATHASAGGIIQAVKAGRLSKAEAVKTLGPKVEELEQILVQIERIRGEVREKYGPMNFTIYSMQLIVFSLIVLNCIAIVASYRRRRLLVALLCPIGLICAFGFVGLAVWGYGSVRYPDLDMNHLIERAGLDFAGQGIKC